MFFTILQVIGIILCLLVAFSFIYISFFEKKEVAVDAVKVLTALAIGIFLIVLKHLV